MLQKSVTGVAFSSQIEALFLITAVWKYPGCQRPFMRGFWFRPTLKKCLRPAADETKLPDAREKKTLVPTIVWKILNQKNNLKKSLIAMKILTSTEFF